MPAPVTSERRAHYPSGQMAHSQDKFGIHLAQALSYLQSPHRHIKTWAALFIGDRGWGCLGGPRAAPPEPLPLPGSGPPTYACHKSASGAKGPLAREGRWGEGALEGHSGSEPLKEDTAPSTGQRASPSVCASFCAGYTICYHPQAVSQTVNDKDTKLLLCSKQPRPRPPIHTLPPHFGHL